MSDTEAFWSGEFGDSYTRRNQVNWRARIPFWDHIIKTTGARAVYEIGCNAGWNLSAIQYCASPVKVSGEDVNVSAIQQARNVGVVSVYVASTRDVPVAELVFTAGVLIHQSPDELPKMMQRIIDMSYRWVLAVEYASDHEEEVEYRGHTGRLWKRPYGKLYQAMGLTLLEEGEAQGFDRCHYWLLEK